MAPKKLTLEQRRAALAAATGADPCEVRAADGWRQPIAQDAKPEITNMFPTRRKRPRESLDDLCCENNTGP